MNRIKQHIDGTASMRVSDGSIYNFPITPALINLEQLDKEIAMGEALLELDEWLQEGK